MTETTSIKRVRQAFTDAGYEVTVKLDGTASIVIGTWPADAWQAVQQYGTDDDVIRPFTSSNRAHLARTGEVSIVLYNGTYGSGLGKAIEQQLERVPPKSFMDRLAKVLAERETEAKRDEIRRAAQADYDASTYDYLRKQVQRIAEQPKLSWEQVKGYVGERDARLAITGIKDAAAAEEAASYAIWALELEAKVWFTNDDDEPYLVDLPDAIGLYFHQAVEAMVGCRPDSVFSNESTRFAGARLWVKEVTSLQYAVPEEERWRMKAGPRPRPRNKKENA